MGSKIVAFPSLCINFDKYLRVDGDGKPDDPEKISQPEWGQFKKNVKIVKMLPVTIHEHIFTKKYIVFI